MPNRELEACSIKYIQIYHINNIKELETSEKYILTGMDYFEFKLYSLF